MNHTITLPSLDEITARIRACREELTALKKLQRLAKAAHLANETNKRQLAVVVLSAKGRSDER
jgi:hypothetical protein